MIRRLTAASARPSLRLAAIALLFTTGPAGADADPSAAVASLLRAQEVARAALAAHGEIQAIAGIRTIGFEAAGPSFNALQSPHPAHFEGHDPDGRFRVRNLFDFGRGRHFQEIWQDLPGGFALHSGTIAVPDTTTNLGFVEGTYNRRFGPAASRGATGLVDVASRFLAPLVLRKMLDAPGSLRWIAELQRPAGAADLIEFNWDATTRCRLLIERGTHRVLETRVLQPDPVVGTDEARIVYVGERRVGGITFPDSVLVHRRGGRALALAITHLSLEPVLAPELYEPPGGMREVQVRDFESVALGGGLHEIRGIGGGAYRAHFIVLADQVVAFDPLLNPAIAGRILAEIRKVAGDRPVRHVVVSHFHADHAGGVAAMLRAGAMALVPAGSEAAVRRYATSISALAGLAPPPPPPSVDRIEPVTGERAIRDSAGRVCTVMSLGAVPHVGGLLVLYDEANRTLVSADLFSRAMPFNQTFAALDEWIERKRLKVDRIVGTHHDPIPYVEFRELARAYRASVATGK
jgi:glyoxylase-like metal-dependent hydrolase (beta-lactamase superfamily II)